MAKVDFKKKLKPLYGASAKFFALVDVPAMQFVKMDGAGDPNTAPAYQTALQWLYGVSYALKFASKAAGQDYVVPPLEGVWWADDPASFVTREKHLWHWTMMIMVPDFVTGAMYDDAVLKTAGKLGLAPTSLRFEPYAEGLSLQILHIGSYDAEGPVLARLHDVVMPDKGLTFNGPHHEIYLGDPRKTEAAKLKTILRQPVKPVT
jgi:hypothetical protein